MFTIRDSGFDPVSASDVDVLDNALGYVLNQEATAHFSPDNFKAYAFKLDYAVVTFPSGLDGVTPRRSSNTSVLLTSHSSAAYSRASPKSLFRVHH